MPSIWTTSYFFALIVTGSIVVIYNVIAVDAIFCPGREEPVGHCDEEWKKEFNPVCERNNVLMIESRRDPNKLRPLVGRDCSHKFCPEDSECVKGKHLAYCCGKTNPPKGMYRVRYDE
ncbi:hypothetical protein ANCCEY_12127 [Ancylostoma ceylanicum]|uniref:Uncharacterized protein n=1 Tax=Ancylostoma ceylanicum TaxID=53326 RepID=A0A0D6LC30_9BILA|nr:hypothetical protein ANCCEY_12127 [Ancylostoma ceylanicum]